MRFHFYIRYDASISIFIEITICDILRSMLLSATRYARSISSLDKKKIPRLLMMEKILMREQDEQSSSERSQEEYSSSSSVEDAGYGQS